MCVRERQKEQESEVHLVRREKIKEEEKKETLALFLPGRPASESTRCADAISSNRKDVINNNNAISLFGQYLWITKQECDIVGQIVADVHAITPILSISSI